MLMGCVIPHWKEFDKAKKCGSGFFSYGPDVLKGGGLEVDIFLENLAILYQTDTT